MADQFIPFILGTFSGRTSAIESSTSALWSNAPIEEIALRLQLDESQKITLTKVFNSLKDADCAAYMALREDGGSLLDDILLDIASGTPEEQAWEKGIGRLEEMMPGTSHTYKEQHHSAYLKAVGIFAKVLAPEQMTHFETLNIEWWSVITGYDGFAGPIEERRKKLRL